MIKISEMIPANPLTGVELLEVVQDGINKRINASELSVEGKSAYDIALANGFVGTEVSFIASLKGVAGINGTNGDSAYTLAVTNGFVGTEVEWLLTLKGQVGDDAYAVSVAAGFVGTQAEWLASLKGAKGDTGAKGAIGLGLNVIGRLDDISQLALPADRNTGDTYVINGHFWTLSEGSWQDLGSVQGVAGLNAFEMAVAAGFVGTYDEWILSLRGIDGIGLRIMGSLQATTLLPDVAMRGDAYIINGKMYVWDTIQWSPVGQVGATGTSAYQAAVSNGFVGSIPQWLDSLKGKTAYQVAKELGQPNTGSEAAWLDSLKGIQGLQGDIGLTGLKGDMGAGVKILGKLNASSELGTTGVLGEGYLITGNFWGWTGAAYENLGPVQGPKGDQGIQGLQGLIGLTGLKGDTGLAGTDGKDAYAIAVDNGFVGTKAEWLISIQGLQGEQGLRGPIGAAGLGLVVIGNLANASLLPVTAAENATYVVAGNLFVFLSGAWVDMGRVTGDSAFEVAVSAGFLGTQAEWLASLKGLKGDTGATGPQGFIGVTGSKGIQGIQGLQGATGLQGIQGIQGITGAGLKILGELANSTLLPASATLGDAYLIAQDLWVYDGAAFVNAGPIKGPKGDIGLTGKSAFEIAKVLVPTLTSEAEYLAFLKGETGIQGEQGLQGDIGLKGDAGITGEVGAIGPMGPGISILGTKATTADLPTTGTLGSGYIIGLDFWGWTGAAYVNLGPIQGPKGDRGPKGDVGPTGATGLTGPKGDKGDVGTKWILLDRDPTAVDGRTMDSYLNISSQEIFLKVNTTTWASQGRLGGGNVYDAASDGIKRVRLNGGWVQLPVDDVVAAAPGYYVRTTTGWVRLDRYDVATNDSTGALDLAVQQAFTISATVARTLSFANVPDATRAMTVAITLTGTGGVITWPVGITWLAGAAPTLGTTITVVVLFWTGTQWVGTVPGSV